MNQREIRRLINELGHIRVSGTEAELSAAEGLRAACEALGVPARLESFPVEMGEVRAASLLADGREVPCKGFRLCGSGSVEAPLCYLPNTEPTALAAAKGKVVLLDTGVTHFLFQDLLQAGAVGIITYDGNLRYADNDMDLKELRPYVSEGKKLLCVNINAKDAFRLVKDGVKTVRLAVEQEEYEGESHNVVAELPGEGDEWIVLTAHYDSTPLSRGVYDNLTGCLGLLEIMDALKGKKRRFGLRFVFCGSEERGLLGSKAWVRDHEDELKNVVLNINLDMIGSVMGGFAACVSAEEGLVSYLRYLSAELGWPVRAWQGVYSSDSTPFADKGVPALSFARLAPQNQATIHNRYDTEAVLSIPQIQKDSAFITAFTRRMAEAAACPVKREIPKKVQDELDKYLNRKRKD